MTGPGPVDIESPLLLASALCSDLRTNIAHEPLSDDSGHHLKERSPRHSIAIARSDLCGPCRLMPTIARDGKQPTDGVNRSRGGQTCWKATALETATVRTTISHAAAKGVETTRLFGSLQPALTTPLFAQARMCTARAAAQHGQRSHCPAGRRIQAGARQALRMRRG